MPELPYLDEQGDLHVTAAMAHAIHEAVLEADAGIRREAPPMVLGRPHPIDLNPLYMSPARILDERLAAILGEWRWHHQIKPRLQGRAVAAATAPMVCSMRILIDQP